MKIAAAWIPAGLLENSNHGSKPVNQNLCKTMHECGSSAPALEENHRAKTDFPRKNNFVNFCIFDCPDKGRRNWNALRPRGPSLFRSAGKGSKRGRFARHFGSGKIKPRSNPFGEPSQTRRFTSSQTHGKVRFCPTGKNPSRATQSDSAGAASASGKLFRAQSLFSVSFFVKPIFAHRMLLRSRSFESPSCSRASLFSAFVRPL